MHKVTIKCLASWQRAQGWLSATLPGVSTTKAAPKTPVRSSFRDQIILTINVQKLSGDIKPHVVQ